MRTPTERDQVRLLDAFWDDSQQLASAPPDLDPGLIQIVQHLTALNDRVMPRPAFAQELWTRLPTAAPLGSPSTIRLRRPRQAHRVVPSLPVARLAPPFRRPVSGAVSTASAVVLTLLLVVVAFRAGDSPSHSAVPSGQAEATTLWNARYDEQGVLFSELDAETLADVSTQTGKASIASASWILSADGGTLVTFDLSDHGPLVVTGETTVEVYDGVTGPRRARYQYPDYVANARLSADGSRLAIDALRYPMQTDPSEWHIIETNSGRLTSVVPADPDQGRPAGSWIDPGGTRGYRLFLRSSSNMEPGPWPAIVVGYDLITGEEVSRLELSEVRGGLWVIGTTVDSWGNSYPTARILQPGVAISPDGRTLALVHADEDAVTLIDAERMAVERTVSFERQASLGERMLGFLSLAPSDAAAKSLSLGTVRQAAFSANGRHVYVWGYERINDEREGIVERGSGLRLIDLASGTIVQEAQGDTKIYDLSPTVDGRHLYVSVIADASDGGALFWLARLDPLSLHLETERFLEGSPTILVRPAVPTGEGYHPEGEGYR